MLPNIELYKFMCMLGQLDMFLV